ncbi:hypothetical protein [Nostocoides australiense]
MQPKRRGIIPLILGLLLMFIGAPGLLVGGATYAFKGAADVAKAAPVHQPGDTVALTANEPVFVLVDVGPGNGTSVETVDGTIQSCEIASSSGASLTRESDTKLRATFDGRTWESAGGFTAPADGDYAFTCSGPTKILTGDDAEKLGGKTLMAVIFGVLGSIVVGLLGLILTIVGIVKLVRSGRERRMGGGGYGGYGQGGAPYGAPTQPYGDPSMDRNAYAVPPPPGASGTSAQGTYDSVPPQPYGASSQPPAYTPPSQGPVPPAPGASTTPSFPAYGDAPSSPGGGTQGGSTAYDADGNPTSELPKTPPPPPPSGPTYRDPTA